MAGWIFGLQQYFFFLQEKLQHNLHFQPQFDALLCFCLFVFLNICVRKVNISEWFDKQSNQFNEISEVNVFLQFSAILYNNYETVTVRSIDNTLIIISCICH